MNSQRDSLSEWGYRRWRTPPRRPISHHTGSLRLTGSHRLTYWQRELAVQTSLSQGYLCRLGRPLFSPVDRIDRGGCSASGRCFANRPSWGAATRPLVSATLASVRTVTENAPRKLLASGTG
jgi:hypothetical protein